MGVGEYINAKEGYQHHQRSNSERLFKVQQQQDKQSKERPSNGLPYSRFSRPPPPLLQNDDFGGYQQNGQAIANYKSVFDTDVEGIDDSTITVTSAADNESVAHGFEIFDRQHITPLNWNESVPSESDRSVHPAGDQVELDEDHAGNSPVFVEGDEADADDEVTQTLDWVRHQAPHQPATANPKRNSQGGRADQSRIPRASSRMALNRSDSDPVTRFTTAATTTAAAAEESKVAYRAGNNNNFSRSLATTPSNRFNFKTERSYERLIQQQSPTRRASGPRPQPERQNSSKPTGLFKRDQAKREQESSFSRHYYDSFIDDNGIRSTLNVTDDGLEDDTISVNIQIPSKSRQRTPAAAASSPTHHSQSDFDANEKFESDYPNEILQQMQYSELENESFDHIPTPQPMTPKTRSSQQQKQKQVQLPPTPSNAKTAGEKLSYVLQSLPAEEDQHKYLSSMTMPEWEEFGDELIGRLGDMLNKIKDARQARRRTTALFEEEIKRRHDDAQKRHSELDKKLAEMKQGGMGVLKGLNPT